MCIHISILNTIIYKTQPQTVQLRFLIINLHLFKHVLNTIEYVLNFYEMEIDSLASSKEEEQLCDKISSLFSTETLHVVDLAQALDTGSIGIVTIRHHLPLNTINHDEYTPFSTFGNVASWRAT